MNLPQTCLRCGHIWQPRGPLNTPEPLRTQVDWSKANALVDSYKSKLINAPIPSQYGSAWMRSEMENLKLIDSRERIAFSEFWAIWQCCLISTRRVSEISKLEKQTVAKNGKTTAWTIRRSTRNAFRHTATFNTETARILRELIFERPWDKPRKIKKQPISPLNH